MLTWQDRPLAALLDDHGLVDRPEHPFPTDGWSGARFSFVERGHDRFVIKRTSVTTDWIAAATKDPLIREAVLATSLLAGPRAYWSEWPYLGAAADGDDAAILMPDLSTELIAWERPSHEAAMPVGDLDRVIGAVARLHVHPWYPWARVEANSQRNIDAPFPWCPLPERLLLTSRLMCAVHRASGIAAGVSSADRLLAGWDAFDRRASRAAYDLVTELVSDVSPLTAALSALPNAGLHGDLKFANVALGPEDEDVSFIDWQMTLRAPVAVDLGWLLVSNSASLPEQPVAVLDRYRSWVGSLEVMMTAAPIPATSSILGDWDRQVDLSWIVGLLLRGWRKGLDAEKGATLGSGMSGAADLGLWCSAAVEAAARAL